MLDNSEIGSEHPIEWQILNEAAEIVTGRARAEYGGAEDSFQQIATGWSLIIDHVVTAKQVALMMCWMKIAREVNGPKRDNMVDLAGYAALAGRLQQ